MAAERDGERVTPFDDLLFDAEVIVERAGCAQFTIEDMGALLGLSPKSVWRLVGVGKLQRPNRYEPLETVGVRAVWTCAQAAEILAERRRPERIPQCGTHAGWSRHRRLGEPICDPCREAHNAYNRAAKERSRDAARTRNVKLPVSSAHEAVAS